MESLLTNLLSIYRIEYLTIDENFQILETSPGINRLSDIYEEVQLGEDIRIVFPEIEGLEDIFDAIRQGEQNNFELKGIRRSPDTASPLYININITKVENYSNKIIIFVEDVTERMVLEQSLFQGANEANLLLRNNKAAKQYIDQILTSMADGLLVTTLSGNIKKINPAAKILLEYDESELIGQPISKIFREVDRCKLAIGEIESIVTTQNPEIPLLKEVETICQTKSGKTIPIAVSYSIVQTEVEHFQGYVYILRDMTERKQAELAKQEFLAMISHEVRTPIASVIGMASLLLNTGLTTEQRDFVETIYTSGNALLEIINDFLDLSKIESGKLELEEQPFALRTCINEALSLLAPKAREKKLKLTFLDTPELPTTIVGDITRLRQVLINLLSNALKFTETGSIEVSVINRQLHDTTEEIQFTVKDTGIGIPRDRLERLFKAFIQVNSSITRQYGGTGLGLAICKQLCELMGGRIWVESEPGIGSKFHFTITVTVIPEEVRSRESGVNDAQIDTHLAEQYPLRILLAEDNAINQKMIGLMLQGMGYQPDIANNGLEVISALRRQRYDVVLMDVQMPEMDGLTASQHICQEWTPQNRPRLIALTASAMWGDRENCLAAGMDDYLAKPIRIAELMRVLKRCQPLSAVEKPIENQAKVSHPIDSTALENIRGMAEFNTEVEFKEFVREIINDYLEDAPKILQNMRVALSQGNFKNLRLATHTLYSTSATLGAMTLASHCAELEIVAAVEELEKATAGILMIETEYQNVEIALQQERQKL
ncbi:multi-sensor hybrid histidine kinase [Calothrix sp. NIES-2100]|uniref:ATP-binding protein n=1 Tax=Calothrix sp. NIES-2100 TaxID=1954172 RepID=UPI000B5F1C7B|nr:multi-sensor hybrid histidine kinase [Calothrix sp. NIES-2100]